MPEDEFETTEFKERLEEATEHALATAERRELWVTYLAFATAVIAVLAAIAALESGAYSNEALMQKNEALLARARASDQWAFYQAKSVKATIYSVQSEELKSSNPELSARARTEADRYTGEEQEISKGAQDFEREEKKQTELSAESMEHHHRFAYGVTMFQIGIALSAVAALSRRKAVWYFGLGIAGLGLVYFLDGFWVFF